jgi:peptidyl-prolyl cis-trans isomerase B (cyclophilin B)
MINPLRRKLVLFGLAAPWAASAFSAPKNGKTPMVKLTTNFGLITLELNAQAAPETVANFLQYTRDGHYDGTIFHRVIDGFMIQGGGFTTDMQQKATRPPIRNEADNGLKNEAYTIAMARTPNPDSATSQFFINVANNDFLNFREPSAQGYGYCVFGKVVEGRDVVDRIRKVRTGMRAGHQDVPMEDVIIEKVEVQE